MAARAYALESLMYRTAGAIDARIAASGSSAAATLQALEEFAVEASIAKVYGSEVVDFVIDEALQIFGGNGFVADYPIERRYRDARVNRIFEGTNEINRLLIPGMLIKKAVKGDLPLMAAAKALQAELVGPPAMHEDDGPLAAERRATIGFKKVVLQVAGVAMQRHGERLQDEQEVLSHLADIVIDAYAAESAVLRALAATARPGDASLHVAAATAVVHEASGRIELSARSALAALAEGDTARVHLAALRRLLKLAPANLVEVRRRLADATVAAGGYPFP